MPESKDQISVKELLLNVIITQDAIVELLEEKGLISKTELMQKITDINAEIRAKKN